MTPRSEQFGTISVGFRALPPLPTGQAADFLVIQAGEDPTLYGFRAEDKVFGNQFLTVFKKNPALLARYDATRQDDFGLINRDKPLLITPAGTANRLEFKAGAKPTAYPAPQANQYLSVGVGSLEPQTLELELAGNETRNLALQPGLSTFQVPLGSGVNIRSVTGQAILAGLGGSLAGNRPGQFPGGLAAGCRPDFGPD